MTEELICPSEHKHAENATCYVSHGCRCTECRIGRAEYEFWRSHHLAAGHELLVNATGTRRRIRALVAIGWSTRQIGARCGRTKAWASHVMSQRRVSKSTAAAVREVYDLLAMTVPDPQTPAERGSVTKTKAWAREHGWMPPLAWDDDEIDDPAAKPDPNAIADHTEESPFRLRLDSDVIDAAFAGEKPRLSPPEKRHIVTVLNARRWSAARIAAWCGFTSKTVERIRTELELDVPTQMDIRDATPTAQRRAA